MRSWWEERYYWYLVIDNSTYVGPFKSMTKAVMHRKSFGPNTAEIEYRSASMFGDLFPPVSPEQHRFLRTTRAIEQ